ncbi:class I SAM-dependent methyltransferase [Massilia sp. DD77]|uniref:class I SAM-dependent methyltransferase n=1 Tax=Massilia sp. DD77 TaxID=3109349 RepID=UPI0030008142
MNKDAVAADVASYYARNAERYHTLVEQSEERSEDLMEAGEQLAILLSGHRVLELACGTGVWTEMIAQSAESVVATDINEEMLEVARELGEGLDNVQWRQADVFDLPADLGNETNKFTAVFMAGLWAHFTRDQQDLFLAQLKKRLGKDVLLVLVDDEYIEGESATIARTDAQGTTWQIVEDEDGSRHELPKSYPTDSALRKRLGNAGKEIKIARWEFYWVLTCRLK